VHVALGVALLLARLELEVGEDLAIDRRLGDRTTRDRFTQAVIDALRNERPEALQ
jgi:hypothetical protein